MNVSISLLCLLSCFFMIPRIPVTFPAELMKNLRILMHPRKCKEYRGIHGNTGEYRGKRVF